MRALFAAAAFFFSSQILAASWRSGLPEALETAKGKRALVLVDFYAPWCYSCYYMDRNVLNQPELRNLSDRLELVKVDVDSPEGARLKSDWAVGFLPTYVILDAQSREVGRIVGEQARAEFFHRLRGILEKNASLQDLEGSARREGRGALDAAREALTAHNRRGGAKEGLAFLKSLPPSIRKAVELDGQGRVEVLRLRLGQARAGKDAGACLDAGRALLRMDLGCEYPYDAMRVNNCVQSLPTARTKALKNEEIASAMALVDTRVLIKTVNTTSPVMGERCADMRSAVSLVSELLREAGRKPEADRLLDRAIRLLQEELGGDLSRDRSKADNLRAFLAMAERHAELDELYPALIKAYPNDYVYPYRFARHLLARGRAAEALERIKEASKRAYGANRLHVSEVRARALAALGRKQDAVTELAQTAEENKDAFPEEAASLRRLRGELAR